MSESLREKFARMKEAPPKPPIEAVTDFLQMYVQDFDYPSEVHSRIRKAAAAGASRITQGLAGIEALLANPPADKELIDLVEWQGNKVMEEPQADNARSFLAELATMAREALAQTKA